MKNILIIGSGLIGSSVLRAVHARKLSRNIYVYEKSKKNISVIKKLKFGCKIINKLDNVSNNFDLIILCTPMSQYKNVITKINKNILNNAIVTDIGSTKDKIWIPSHPIAGSEITGAEHGDKNLFKNKWCVLIKEKNTKKKYLSKLRTFWKKLGSKVIIMNSKQHDIIFSMTSHLPHLIAYNLVKTAKDFEKKKKYNLIKYSAGGLRDFSRIAASNEIMWRDVFFSNQKNIIFGINLFIRNLNLFKKNIKRRENKQLIKKLINSKKVRKQIIQLKQDIDRPDFGR